MTSLSMFIPPLWQYAVIFISSLFIFTIPTWINPHRRQPFPPRKRVVIWRLCNLPYWLVHRYCRRPRHPPPRLEDSFFPLTHCKTDWYWRRMSIRDRYFCNVLTKFMASCKNIPAKDNFGNNKIHSLLTRYVYQAAHEMFCDDEYCDFLKLPLLLSTLNYIDHVYNVKNLMLIWATLLLGSILENRLHQPGYRKCPRKLIFIWDTGA